MSLALMVSESLEPRAISSPWPSTPKRGRGSFCTQRMRLSDLAWSPSAAFAIAARAAASSVASTLCRKEKCEVSMPPSRLCTQLQSCHFLVTKRLAAGTRPNSNCGRSGIFSLGPM